MLATIACFMAGQGTMMAEHLDRSNAASTGLLGSVAGFLDAHFEALRPGYEAMLRSVGLQPGWRVLDAACGSGGFLPLIAEHIGPSGAITAFDLAPDTVAQKQSDVGCHDEPTREEPTKGERHVTPDDPDRQSPESPWRGGRGSGHDG
jgi:SAM-dependent methyltransferase